MRHFMVMLLFAAIVAIIFGIIGREKTPERLAYGAKIFGEFLGFGLALAWLLYLLPL